MPAGRCRRSARGGRRATRANTLAAAAGGRAFLEAHRHLSFENLAHQFQLCTRASRRGGLVRGARRPTSRRSFTTFKFRKHVVHLGGRGNGVPSGARAGCQAMHAAPGGGGAASASPDRRRGPAASGTAVTDINSSNIRRRGKFAPRANRRRMAAHGARQAGGPGGGPTAQPPTRPGATVPPLLLPGTELPPSASASPFFSSNQHLSFRNGYRGPLRPSPRGALWS